MTAVEQGLRELVAELVREEVGKALAHRDTKPANDETDPFLSVKQAAEFLTMAPVTLHQMRQQQRGPAWCKAGRRVLYRRSAIEAWLVKKNTKGA